MESLAKGAAKATLIAVQLAGPDQLPSGSAQARSGSPRFDGNAGADDRRCRTFRGVLRAETVGAAFPMALDTL